MRDPSANTGADLAEKPLQRGQGRLAQPLAAQPVIGGEVAPVFDPTATKILAAVAAAMLMAIGSRALRRGE